MEIIDKIKKMQWERGWTDYKLAVEAGTTSSTIATMYKRKTPPKIELLQRICEAYGITLAQFFLEDEKIEILSADELKLMALFRKLPRDKRKSLLDLLS